MTRLHHLSNNLHQRPILQSRRYTLFITQLLIHLVTGTMRSLLDPHIDAEPRWEGLLEAHSHAQPDDGG